MTDTNTPSTPTPAESIRAAYNAGVADGITIQKERAIEAEGLDVKRLVHAFYNTPQKSGWAETEAEYIARVAVEYNRLTTARRAEHDSK